MLGRKKLPVDIYDDTLAAEISTPQNLFGVIEYKFGAIR
jgi:hypothetical protein